MNETTDIQDMSDQERKQIAEAGPGGGNMLMDRQAFAQAYQVARLFSSSQLVPQHLQGKPHDCFIALHMANRLGEDPLMVMQNIVIVHGTAGWKAQWLIGRANRSGVFKGRIKFRTEGSGNDMKVTAYATMADTGEEVEASADMNMAHVEGWTKNQKYKSMPQQMLSYRAASFLIRLYCPEATLGYQSAEEVEDMAAAGQMRDVTPGRHTPTDEPQNGGAERALRDLPEDAAPPQDDAQGQQHAPTSTATTSARVDQFGTPWDARIHAQSMSTNKDGSWRKKRGISDEYFAEIMAELKGLSEPAQSDESGDPGEAGEGPGDEPAQQQGLPDDFDTGEIPGESAPAGDPSTEPVGSGPSDSEIVQSIQKHLQPAREAGDLDTIADLEDEAREIQSEGWRLHYQGQLAAARDAIEKGQS